MRNGSTWQVCELEEINPTITVRSSFWKQIYHKAGSFLNRSKINDEDDDYSDFVYYESRIENDDGFRTFNGDDREDMFYFDSLGRTVACKSKLELDMNSKNPLYLCV